MSGAIWPGSGPVRWPEVSIHEEAVADLEAQTAALIAEAETPEAIEARRRAPLADILAVMTDLAAELMAIPGARASDLHEAVALGMSRVLASSGVVEEVFGVLPAVNRRHLSASGVCKALAKARGVPVETVERDVVDRALLSLLESTRVAYTFGEYNGYSYKAWYSLGGPTVAGSVLAPPAAPRARRRR